MKIQVTEQDIDQGQEDNCDFCPIALAMRRCALSGASVMSQSASWQLDDGSRVNAVLPQEAAKFVSDFDDGKPVQPFTFNLEPQ